MVTESFVQLLLGILGVLILAWQGWLTVSVLACGKQMAEINVRCSMRIDAANKRDETIGKVFDSVRRIERNQAVMARQMKLEIEDPT